MDAVRRTDAIFHVLAGKSGFQSRPRVPGTLRRSGASSRQHGRGKKEGAPEKRRGDNLHLEMIITPESANGS